METFWVNLAAIDFRRAAAATLTLVGGKNYAGDATAKFRKSAVRVPVRGVTALLEMKIPGVCAPGIFRQR